MSPAELILAVALVVAALLFAVGVYGALSQTNLVMIVMGIELMLGASMLVFIAFWRILYPGAIEAQTFVLVVMTVMALDAAVGFAIATARFRARGSVEVEDATDLKG
jgi:NAD(P)H-quinone oxidoreductase subunit 4L